MHPISSGLRSQTGSGWLIRGWGQIFRRDCSETNSLEKGGNAVKVLPDRSKITKAERIEEVVLMHVWPSGIKALPDTNSYF
jgi:hypothetical protein